MNHKIFHPSVGNRHSSQPCVSTATVTFNSLEFSSWPWVVTSYLCTDLLSDEYLWWSLWRSPEFSFYAALFFLISCSMNSRCLAFQILRCITLDDLLSLTCTFPPCSPSWKFFQRSKLARSQDSPHLCLIFQGAVSFIAWWNVLKSLLSMFDVFCSFRMWGQIWSLFLYIELR